MKNYWFYRNFSTIVFAVGVDGVAVVGKMVLKVISANLADYS